MIVESFLNPRREFLESPADGRTKHGGVSRHVLSEGTIILTMIWNNGTIMGIQSELSHKIITMIWNGFSTEINGDTISKRTEHGE